MIRYSESRIGVNLVAMHQSSVWEVYMHSNSFLSSAGSNLHSVSSTDRMKSFFKPPSELSGTQKNQQTYHEQLKLSLSKQSGSGQQVFSKSIEFSLGIKTESSYEFKIPSPKEVAATVLGFVENRINAEKASGASTERLNDLMAQAKSGIEKGYGQARKDIEGLGLMTDELSKDISEGFDLINVGLDKISQEINNPGLAKENDKQLASQLTPSSEAPLKDKTAVGSLFNSDKSDVSSNALSRQYDSSVASAASVKQITENTADFVLNTQEGDQILIRMSDLQQASYEKTNLGEALTVGQSFRFEFSVKGDLNEQELQAINSVLEQVDNISSLFFSDQFDAAFSSAMNLGFDPKQIASFSLDLSKLQVQEVRVYETGSKDALDSYKRNQPLINMAQQFERLDSLLQPLERFKEMNSMIEALVSKAIDNYSVESDKAGEDLIGRMADLQEFSKSLMDGILTERD